MKDKPALQSVDDADGFWHCGDCQNALDVKTALEERARTGRLMADFKLAR